MSNADNKCIVGRWLSEFWGKDFNAAVIDEPAAPAIRVLKIQDGLTAPRQLGLASPA
jgi:hypothetical protein